MNDLPNFFKEETNKIKFTSDSTKTAFKEITSFYHNAENFMKTKRFDRFVELVERKFETFLNSFDIVRVSESCKQKVSPSIVRCFGTAVLEYSANKVKPERAEASSDAVSDRGRICLSCLNLVSGIPYKTNSPLFDLNEYAGANNGINISYGTDKIKLGDETINSPLLGFALAIVRNDMFPYICCSCIERACYDYIQLKSLEQELSDENWYSTLKRITNEQVIWLMSKSFEHILYEIEARAGCQMLLSMSENSPVVFQELQETKERANALEAENAEKDKRINELIIKHNRELQETKSEYTALQNKVSGTQDNSSEIAMLKRKLKAAEQEKQALRKKLKSAEEYADSLLETANEPVPESEPDTTIDPAAFADKRIVFVRDKFSEDYPAVKRLAEVIPNAKFTNCIASDINAKATDLIVVLTSYVHHHTTYNADSIAKGRNIPIIRVNKVNCDIILSEISRALS